MNIGITCYPTYGGSGVVGTELGKALASRGHQIHFISYALPFRLDGYYKNISFHEVETPDYPLFEVGVYPVSLASRMVDVAIYHKLDILHVHYAIPHATSAYLAKQILKSKGYEIKIITTLHGTDTTLIGIDPTLKPIVKYSIEQSDGVTAVSNSLREATISNFEIDEKKIVAIPNFINTEHWSKDNCPKLRSEFAPNNESVLIHISNFRPIKRVLDCIKAFEIIHAKKPTKLLMVGDGPERPEAERLCRELGIYEDVLFLGKQNAIPSILSACDLSLVTSENESFSLTSLESMSCSVPVISTNRGGLPELNINGQTGYLCEVGDINEIAQKALFLLDNKNKLQEMRLNSRSNAEENFSEQKVVPLYEEYYKTILGL